MTTSRKLPFAALGSLALFLMLQPALAADAPAAPPAPPAGPSTDLSTIAKGDYVLDLSHTNVIFEISHLGFSTFIGRFNDISGDLAFRPHKVEKSKLKVTIKVGSVDTKVKALDEHLATADFFDAAKYPEITFKSTKIERTGDTTGRITGDLTLHGVTKPVTLDAVFHGAGVHPMSKKTVLGFGATGTIKRSEFGMTKYVPMLGDDVMLIIEAEFNGKAAD